MSEFFVCAALKEYESKNKDKYEQKTKFDLRFIYHHFSLQLVTSELYSLPANWVNAERDILILNQRGVIETSNTWTNSNKLENL